MLIIWAPQHAISSTGFLKSMKVSCLKVSVSQLHSISLFFAYSLPPSLFLFFSNAVVQLGKHTVQKGFGNSSFQGRVKGGRVETGLKLRFSIFCTSLNLCFCICNMQITTFVLQFLCLLVELLYRMAEDTGYLSPYSTTYHCA